MDLQNHGSGRERAIEVTSRFFHKVGGSPRDFVSDSLVVVNFRL
jgi:hypothetical protein